VTPAHDPNDYVMGKRHNLEFINILHPDGRCNENAGDYEGMDRFEAREAVIEDLKERKLLVKIDPHQHAVGHCYRCHTVIEPYYSKQWFVKMKPLSLPGIEAVKDGRITFHPDRWTKVYLNWMENIQDWCISRQIWWGHRIPAWYCLKCHPELAANKAGKTGAGESLDISLDDIALLSNIDPIVSKTRPKCPHCGSDELMAQDPQVLDTWFSSWLWPFATFGWPFNQTMDHGPRTTVKNEAARDIEQQKKELDYFYPTAVLVTAPEIIFFWVARMIMAGFEFQGNIPFKDVYIHGTVRDDTGKKMSKSLGNSIDPLEIIDEYGTDALRFSLISITAIGQDVFLAKEKFEFGRNFCNKLWNASRFILMNLAPDIAQTGNALDKEKMDLAEAWILSRFSTTLVNLNKALDGYRLNEAANIVYDFFWHQFCDWYIELAKLHIKDAATQRVLYTVLERSLRLLHPFMPFITEEIWQKLKPEGISIMTQAWPREEAQFIDPALEENMQRVIDICTEIRNLRSQNNIKPKDTVDIGIEADNPQIEESVRAYSRYITSLAKVNTLRLVKKNAAALFSACVYGTAGGCTIQMDTGSGLDVGQERERVQAQIGEIEQHIARKDALLNNKNYVQKAPAAVVEKERQSREELLRELEKLRKITNALA
jgi:Valyl-tRNA synthetase